MRGMGVAGGHAASYYSARHEREAGARGGRCWDWRRLRRDRCGGAARDGSILAEAVLSQSAEHAPYGGVVPEIAARAHLDHLPRVRQVMAEAGLGFATLPASPPPPGRG